MLIVAPAENVISGNHNEYPLTSRLPLGYVGLLKVRIKGSGGAMN